MEIDGHVAVHICCTNRFHIATSNYSLEMRSNEYEYADDKCMTWNMEEKWNWHLNLDLNLDWSKSKKSESLFHLQTKANN